MISKPSTSTWITYPVPKPQAAYRLFCFPYAGGAANVYQSWGLKLPANIEVGLVNLPGRGIRWKETAFTHLPALITALGQTIQPELSKPFAFFGYSLGSLVCFELARYLRKEAGQTPVHLFVAAYSAPHIPRKKRALHNLPKAEFLEALRDYNGTPEAVLQHEELMELLIPTLRADFALFETYTHTPDTPLDCPVSAFGGLEDPDVNHENLVAWNKHTSNTFTAKMLPGHHFFFQEQEDMLLKSIADMLV